MKLKKVAYDFVEKNRFLKQIFLCFLLPIMVMLIATFLVYNNYKSLSENQIRNNSLTNLSAAAGMVDTSLKELQNTTLLLSTDSNLYNIFYSDNVLNNLDAAGIQSVTNTLVKFKATKDLIDSVYIIHRKSSEVMTVDGTYSVENYFTRASIYKNYNKNYWMNLNVNTPFYKILAPSSIKSIAFQESKKRNVIPLVTSNIDSFKSKNLLVINIGETQLSNMLKKYKFMPNINLSIINKNGLQFASTDNTIPEKLTKDKSFLKKLTKKNNNFFKCTINGNKYMTISFTSTTVSFNDFIYVAFIPYNDFYSNLVNIKRLAYLIILFGVCISILSAYFMSKKIYSPINNLVNILKKNNPENSANNISEVDYLNTEVEYILKTENNLKNDISLLTPIASAQYIKMILTNTDLIMDKNVKDLIMASHTNFKYNSFCANIVELNFSEKYYSSHDDTQHSLAIRGISKMLENIAIWNYPTQVLHITRTKLCLLINLPQDEITEHIMKNIKTVTSIFSYDSDLIKITVGIGRIYPDFTGMNKSYNEALKVIHCLSSLDEENIKIYSDDLCLKKHNYSIKDENKLYNYLIGCYNEDAINLLNTIIEKNEKENSSDSFIKSLYMSIYCTISRVADEKNISINKIMGNEYIDIESATELLPVYKLNAYIYKLVNKILALSNPNNKFDINLITDYIKNNYTQDIYLEKIATVFNISDKYLSKIFKDRLGIAFHDYLSQIRINKSKEMLLETNLSVIKIGEMVGFSTHSTFFRVFKKNEGISPTQYRNDNKKEVLK